MMTLRNVLFIGTKFCLQQKKVMAKSIKKPPMPAEKKLDHMGYNEKNPAQPEGPFKADSMETKPDVPEGKGPKK